MHKRQEKYERLRNVESICQLQGQTWALIYKIQLARKIVNCKTKDIVLEIFVNL
jgi:hypothetical protein